MHARRLGLFGGTFDPPHFGHVAALEAAARSGNFDRLVAMVAGDPYRKRAQGTVASAANRLAMARAAFQGLDLVDVSDLEVVRVGPSYTLDTVRALLKEADQVDLIVGADLVEQLESWHGADALRGLVRVGVVPRPGAVTETVAGWDIYEIAMEPVDLSSSAVRSAGHSAERLKDFVPEQVIPLYLGARG
jgi:nicotinate-nucleotide adenylyltransferase